MDGWMDGRRGRLKGGWIGEWVSGGQVDGCVHRVLCENKEEDT